MEWPHTLWRLDDLHDIAITGDKTNKEPDHWVNIAASNVQLGAGVITDIEMSPAGLEIETWYGTSAGDVYRLDDANAATPVQLI